MEKYQGEKIKANKKKTYKNQKMIILSNLLSIQNLLLRQNTKI